MDSRRFLSMLFCESKMTALKHSLLIKIYKRLCTEKWIMASNRKISWCAAKLFISYVLSHHPFHAMQSLLDSRVLLHEASVHLTQCRRGKLQLALIGLNYTTNPFCSRCQYIKVISETQMQSLIHNFNPSSCAAGYRSGNFSMQKLLKLDFFLIAISSSTDNSKHFTELFWNSLCKN